jgi:hypothetical protein
MTGTSFSGARIRGRCAKGSRSTVLEADGAGHWLIDGERAPWLDGCLEVDLEASAMTNALPCGGSACRWPRRQPLPPPTSAAGLAVERLEQTYARATDGATCQRYDYTAPASGFSARLVYDQSGLVLDYPGIAVRAG